MKTEKLRREVLLENIKRQSWRRVCAVDRDAAAGLIPRILTSLLSDDKGERKWAYSEAISVLWHQGTIYEATGVAMPYLVHMLSVEGLDEDQLFDVSYLLATFALSARGALEGRSACGLQEDGRRILASLESVYGNCLVFLSSDGNHDAKENVVVALTQIPTSTVGLLKVLEQSSQLVALVGKLSGSSYEEACGIFETLDQSQS